MKHHEIEPFDMVLDQFAREGDLADCVCFVADTDRNSRIAVDIFDHFHRRDQMRMTADAADAGSDHQSIKSIASFQNRFHPPKMDKADISILDNSAFIGFKIEDRFPFDPLDQFMRYHRSTSLRA